MMLHVNYFAVNREPVGVNVERRHEYRQLNRFPFYEFRFVYLFYHNYFAVYGTYAHSPALPVINSFGTAEKVEHKGVDHHTYAGAYRGYGYGRHKQPRRDVDSYEHYEEDNQDVGPLMMDFNAFYLHLL